MLPPDISQPAKGAYATLPSLIALRFPAAQLRLGKPRRALSALAGPHIANFRGRGLEFEEVRAYQPGDDIRTIDWRVTARTGEAHTKRFREERERPVMIITDQRNSQFFGSQHCFKAVLAAQLSSLLAWSALNAGDRVGGLVFNDIEHRELRPKRSRKNVLGLLSSLVDFNSALPVSLAHTPPGDDSFSQMLEHLRRIARPGTRLFIVSDFTGATTAAAREQWFELARHTEILALACNDPLEATLPRAGTYTVTDGTARSQLNTANRRLRQDYADGFSARQAALSDTLSRLGIPVITASTDQSPFGRLQRYFGETRR